MTGEKGKRRDEVQSLRERTNPKASAAAVTVFNQKSLRFRLIVELSAMLAFIRFVARR